MTTLANLTNRRILLRARPSGLPGPEHFAEDECAVPEPVDGEVVLETVYVSVDPAMRVWMGENPGYVPPVQVGEVMRAGGIGRVIASNARELSVGDLVQGRLGWQSHLVAQARYLQKLDLALGTARDWIGPLGGTALTAYFGMRNVAQVTGTDVVLVSAASGGVGQIAAQIGKIEGCHVIGIAGGPEKCAFLTGELGLDTAIDYRASSDIAADIARACPDGIDVYFDNVGGPILDAALGQLRRHGRVALCGRISQTASETPHGICNLGQLIGRGGRVEGFLVYDFAAEFDAARAWLAEQVKTGRLKQRLHVLDGLGHAPEGLAMLFHGQNTGKLVVQVAPE